MSRFLPILFLPFTFTAFAEELPAPAQKSAKSADKAVAVTASPPIPTATAWPVPLVRVPGAWIFQPALSDEFNGSGINTVKWETDPGSWGPWSWDSRNAVQGQGHLALTMTHEPHVRAKKTLYHKSGIVRSRAEVTYGYFEARIKGCPLFPGASPAFWLYSVGDRPGRVSHSEIDIVEMQQDSGPVKRPRILDFNLYGRIRSADGTEVAIGPGWNSELCEHSWRAPFDPRKGFHVYSALVTPRRITWYVDGREVAAAENLYWRIPMRIILSLGLRAPYVRDEGGEKFPVPQKATGRGFPTSMEVDYVRVWTPVAGPGAIQP